VGGHRPPRLLAFARDVVSEASQVGAGTVLTTGLCPVTAAALVALGRMGVRRLHYSTDDPWNARQRARWFLRALPHYDTVFTTRRANLQDFRALGCRAVRYLPFGYDPLLFHAASASEAAVPEFRSRVLFVGGADRDRVPLIETLVAAGVPVTLYGDYWTRYPGTRQRTRGHARPETVRLATAAADVCLCLVRRANRDGHVMRSLEIPAVGACMLVEDTEEHRDLFGDDGQTVRYFDSSSAMVDIARRLLGDPPERARLAEAVHRRITSGGHTYRDRLVTMLAPLQRTG
jgi:spore maturation protein CgeB